MSQPRLALLLLVLLLAHQVHGDASLGRSHKQPMRRGAGRSLAQAEAEQQAMTTINSASTATDNMSKVLKAAEGADNAAKALNAASKAAAFLSVTSSFLGVVGPVVGIALAFAGGTSETDQLIIDGFREVNRKLDALTSDVAQLKDDVLLAISAGFADMKWNDLAREARETAVAVSLLLNNTNDQALAKSVMDKCNNKDPQGAFTEMQRVIVCTEGSATPCLTDIIKQKTEFELAQFFEQARLYMRDMVLAQEMALTCARIEGLLQTTIDDITSRNRKLITEAASGLSDAFNSLYTDFWDTAINKRIIESMQSNPTKSFDDQVKDIYNDLSGRYPFMYWLVAMDTGGGEGHTAVGLDLNTPNAINDVKATKFGGFYKFRVQDNHNVFVAYRDKRFSSSDDADGQLAGLLSGSCKGKARTWELAECLSSGGSASKVVMFGNSFRSVGDFGGSGTGISGKSGKDEGAIVVATVTDNSLFGGVLYQEDVEVSVVFNLNTANTYDAWVAPDLGLTTAPVPTSPAPEQPASPLPASASTFSCLTGGDLMGDEQAISSAASLGECEAQCGDGCTFYVFLVDGTCVLKNNLINGAGGSFAFDGGVYVGSCVRDGTVTASGASFACVTNYDFMGTELSISAGTDSSACLDSCIQTAECSFIIFTTDKTCVLKKDFLAGASGSSGPNTGIEVACLRM